MIVGLTQRIFYHNGQSYDATDHDWYSFFNEHQIAPIRNIPEQNFAAIADKLDVLVITGGNDPLMRRVVETTLARHMVMRHKPVIGVCHGAFLLTELLGGTVGDIENHHNTEHTIYTDTEGEHVVNSFHSLRIVNSPLHSTPLAYDDSGNVESWIHGKIAAIVWHPERMKEPYIPAPILQLLIPKDK